MWVGGGWGWVGNHAPTRRGPTSGPRGALARLPTGPKIWATWGLGALVDEAQNLGHVGANLQLCAHSAATLRAGPAGASGRAPAGRDGRVAFSATLRPLCSYSAGGPGRRQRSRPLLGGRAELHFLQLCFSKKLPGKRSVGGWVGDGCGWGWMGTRVGWWVVTSTHSLNIRPPLSK